MASMAIVELHATGMSIYPQPPVITVRMAPQTITELDHWSIEFADHTQWTWRGPTWAACTLQD